MKILLVDPGADWSTADVYAGLDAGLRALGHTVVGFRYGRKMDIMLKALEATFKARAKSKEPIKTKPTVADAAYITSELVVTWALRQQPDWTVIVSGMYFHPDALVLMRRAGLRTAVLLTESPYDIVKEARFAQLADVAWTNERTAVGPLREVNPRTNYMPHAWHPDRHSPSAGALDGAAPSHDVAFVGTGFRERCDLLQGVQWRGIDLGLYGSWPLLGRSRLRRCVKAGITDNTAAAALYRKAKINLNLFRSSMGFSGSAGRILGSESLGPRAYELAACGAFFVSERRAEIADLFGDLVPTFEGPRELQELLKRWLPDEVGRRRIAAQLPAAVRGHSWVERAKQMVTDLSLAAGSGSPLMNTVRDASAAAYGETPGPGALAVV